MYIFIYNHNFINRLKKYRFILIKDKELFSKNIKQTSILIHELRFFTKKNIKIF